MRMVLLTCLIAFAACGPVDQPKGKVSKPVQGDLADLGAVPEFSFLERAGKPVTRDTLKGKVWVATFIFTNCQTHCVLLCAEMTKLQAEFEDEPDFKILATTVDPARDTPDKLKSFAIAQEADPDTWLFGWHRDIGAVKALAHDGLKLPWDEEALNHTIRMTLIDKQGRIRGYYNCNDRDRMKKLRDDIKTLLK